MMVWLVNLIAFQIGWFACVLGGANAWPWAGTLIAAVLIVFHLSQVARPQPEFYLVLIVAVIGLILDSALIILGFTEYPSGQPYPLIAPHWLIAMWMLFATTLNVSMSWLQGRWWLAIVLGAIGGPLAYYAGYKLGAVAFPLSLQSGIIALAIVWAIAMPLLMLVARHFNGTTTASLSN